MKKILTCLNKLTTNRSTGIPIFLLVMYGMFFFSVCFGGAFQPFFNLTSQALFIELPLWLLNEFAAPDWLQCIIVHGIGRGIKVTVTFIPILTCMFLFLSFLENSGYIARAALVMNNFMNYLGLPGKSFIPMIIGFGCNVPAVVSTRILQKRSERILTIMMLPFISCGSKLAIYAIFAAVFFPSSGQNIVFLLYLIGIMVAIFTGLILRPSRLKKKKFEISLSLPVYRLPSFTIMYKNTLTQVKSFLFKAGSIIIPLCVVVGVLDHVKTSTASDDTVLAMIGKKITPVFAPMGIKQDNWPAVVGLMTGVIAKEVIIGTLTTLYEHEQKDNSQIKPTQDIISDVSMFFSIKQAAQSIPDKLTELKNSFLHPFAMFSANKVVDSKVMGTMFLRFSSTTAAFSYLLFVLLYCPCLSVVVLIMRELGLRWALFSIIWTTGLAYIIAVAFYQAFTVGSILEAILWIAGLIVIFTGFTYLFKTAVYKKGFLDKERLIPVKVS